MSELFLEIGTEEIPARFIPPSMEELAARLDKELTAARLAHGPVRTMGTPRRLVASVAGVAERQPDEEVVKTGPSVSAAFDKDGKPTKAGIGFAKGQGIDPASLERVQTEKGEYAVARKTVVGRPAGEVLADVLPRLILSLPYPKSMRWGSSEIRFARPIHRVVAVLDGRTVRFEVGDLPSSGEAVGHRFLSPEPFAVDGLADYLAKTRERGLTIDPAERRTAIEARLREIAASVGGQVVPDEALLEEVTFLTESPFPILGTFDRAFLDLPREVVVTPMRAHQKYFPVQDKGGALLPNFIAVSDIEPRDPAVVAKGFEKVLRARLEDARFFFQEDRKKTLDDLAEKLSGMIFQKKLGSYAEKVARVRKVAAYLAREVKADPNRADRAAALCKADLLTAMVGEFPELQGIMGEHYARLAGEGGDVATAIREHYLPRFAGDELPATATGAVVAVADKIDSIAGCFGVGLIPTGSGDPYALRRAALGIVAIIQKFGWSISLSRLIRQALGQLPIDIIKEDKDIYVYSSLTIKEVAPGVQIPSVVNTNINLGISERAVDRLVQKVADFFEIRLLNIFTSRGYANEVVTAVLGAGFDDLCDLEGRLQAVAELHRRPDFTPLAVSFKRVANILEDGTFGPVDPSLFEDPHEGRLHVAFRDVESRIVERAAARDYAGALRDLAELKAPIDAYFDAVLVNCPDEAQRANRKALLAAIATTFRGIADFRRFAV